MRSFRSSRQAGDQAAITNAWAAYWPSGTALHSANPAAAADLLDARLMPLALSATGRSPNTITPRIIHTQLGEKTEPSIGEVGGGAPSSDVNP
jgi:hypothetical protein